MTARRVSWPPSTVYLDCHCCFVQFLKRRRWCVWLSYTYYCKMFTKCSFPWGKYTLRCKLTHYFLQQWAMEWNFRKLTTTGFNIFYKDTQKFQFRRDPLLHLCLFPDQFCLQYSLTVKRLQRWQDFGADRKHRGYGSAIILVNFSPVSSGNRESSVESRGRVRWWAWAQGSAVAG